MHAACCPVHTDLPPALTLPGLAGPRHASLPVLHRHDAGDPRRGQVQDFIARRYRRRYDARLAEWLPVLVSLQHDGEIIAAAGYRSAQAPLFLERYLDAPVQTYLIGAQAVQRRRIAEAGQFAADRPGAGRLLVPLIARHLLEQGHEWVVSTVTRELRELFERMGLAPQVLAPARPARLGASERAAWGSYYAHAPQVVAARLACVVARLEEAGR